MTQYSTEMTNTHEVEFTAGYGTAIVVIPARRVGSAQKDDWRIAANESPIDAGDVSIYAGARPHEVRR